MEKIKVGHPTYFFRRENKVVKTFMASNLLWVLENNKWEFKSQFQRNTHSLWSRQSQNKQIKKHRDASTGMQHLLHGPCLGAWHRKLRHRDLGGPTK